MGNFIAHKKSKHKSSALYRLSLFFSFDDSVTNSINAEIMVHCDNGSYGPIYYNGIKNHEKYTQEYMLEYIGSVQYIELCMRKTTDMINEVTILSIESQCLMADSTDTCTFSVDGEVRLNDVDSISVLLQPKSRTLEKAEYIYDPSNDRYMPDASVSVEAV